MKHIHTFESFLNEAVSIDPNAKKIIDALPSGGRTKQFKLIKKLLDKWKRNYTVIEEPDFMKRIDKIKFLTNVILSKS